VQDLRYPDTLCASPTEMTASPLSQGVGSHEPTQALARPTPPVPIRQSSAPVAITMERSYSLPVATQREFESQWQSVSQRAHPSALPASLPMRRSVAPPQSLCLSEDTTCTYTSRVSTPDDRSAMLCNSWDCWWSYGWPSCGNGMACVSPVHATHTPLSPPSLDDETDSLSDSVQSHSRKHMSWIPVGVEGELGDLRTCKTPPPLNYERRGLSLASETKPDVGQWVSSQVDAQKLPPLPASTLSETMSKHAWTLAAATQKRFFPPIKCTASGAVTPAMAAKSMGTPEPLSFYIHPDHVQ